MSKLIDDIKEQFINIKNQLMYSWNKGAVIGKSMKKSHKKKIKKLGGNKDGKKGKR